LGFGNTNGVTEGGPSSWHSEWTTKDVTDELGDVVESRLLNNGLAAGGGANNLLVKGAGYSGEDVWVTTDQSLNGTFGNPAGTDDEPSGIDDTGAEGGGGGE
jgi:hypothetical protein